MPSPLTYRLRGAGGDQVSVESGRITPGDDAILPTWDVEGRLYPGLINGHDHLHRNHFPRLGSPPYSDMYAWGRDIHARHTDIIARARSVERRDALLFGAFKNLMAGVTTVVHHDRWEPDFDHDFPIRVAKVRCVHSLRLEPGGAASPPGDPRQPLCLHLAEGVTQEMAAEVGEAARLGLVDERLLAVHGVGVDSTGIELLARRRAALVWCPSSNLFLFGCTAPAELLRRVDVVLGSDSLLTGSGTLLDELRQARATRLLDDRRLLAAVGDVAAHRLGLPPPRLDPGTDADLIVLGRPILEAGWRDVKLVAVGGVPTLAEERYEELFDHAGVEWKRVAVAGVPRIVSASLGSAVERIVATWPDSVRLFGDETGTSESRAPHGARSLNEPFLP